MEGSLTSTTQKKHILVTGAAGQIGSELVPVLRRKYGNDTVIAAYYRNPPKFPETETGPWLTLDATDRDALKTLIQTQNIYIVFHLAAILSATGEKNPELCWQTNVTALMHLLELARELPFRVFWASSVAAFGLTAKQTNVTQEGRVIMDPVSIYGISKVSGEALCKYYAEQCKVDIRAIRFPGVITFRTIPQGGTSDFAVEMIHAALKSDPKYNCYITENTRLPWVYTDDAIRGILELMEVPQEKVKIRTYNMMGVSFTPGELAREIQKHIPQFQVTYNVTPGDARQRIADSIPCELDDKRAREDWGWNPKYNLEALVAALLKEGKEIESTTK